MAEVAIAAIVVGAILFAFGLFPGLPLALMEAFQNLRDQFFRSRGRIHRFQTDLPLSGDAWLVGTGGVMLILGLLVLLRWRSGRSREVRRIGHEKQKSGVVGLQSPRSGRYFKALTRSSTSSGRRKIQK
jgi:hypothetical protein